MLQQMATHLSVYGHHKLDLMGLKGKETQLECGYRAGRSWQGAVNVIKIYCIKFSEN